MPGGPANSQPIRGEPWQGAESPQARKGGAETLFNLIRVMPA